MGERFDGGMSELATYPPTPPNKAPAGVDAELGVLGQPLACSVHGFNKVDLRGHVAVDAHA